MSKEAVILETEHHRQSPAIWVPEGLPELYVTFIAMPESEKDDGTVTIMFVRTDECVITDDHPSVIYRQKGSPF